MPTRVGDGHWWFFELLRLLLLSHVVVVVNDQVCSVAGGALVDQVALLAGSRFMCSAKLSNNVRDHSIDMRQT